MGDAAPNPCLVVVDMQNDFVRPGAPFEVPDARAIIPEIRLLVEAFEAARLPVVYSRYIADDSLRRLAGAVPWVAHLEAPIYACTPGHRRRYGDGQEADSAAIIDELSPSDGAIVVDKILYSAFQDTSLDRDLRTCGVTELVVTGVATEICVDDTARHGVHLGYQATLVCDGCASAAADRHAWTMDNFRRNYGRVARAAELAAGLSAPIGT